MDWEAEAAANFADFLRDWIDTYRPGQMMIEQSFVGRPSPTMRWVHWSHVAVALVCRRLELDYRPLGQGAIKKFATGNGRAKPAQMILAARRRGFDVKNDHEADAIHMLLMSQPGAMPGPLGGRANP